MIGYPREQRMRELARLHSLRDNQRERALQQFKTDEIKILNELVPPLASSRALELVNTCLRQIEVPDSPPNFSL
jgi:hypothetical protein